jgi:hypothetical protein
MKKAKNSRTVLLVGAIVALVLIAVGGASYFVRARAMAQPADVSLTLNPEQFQGDTRQAYMVAKEHPELLAQLDCYCGCEQHEGHKNLLDCFRTRHGAGCETCVGEAVTAGKLADQGMPVDQIRQALRERYAHGT